MAVVPAPDPTAGRSLRDRILDAVDPCGEMRQMMEGLGALSSDTAVQSLLNRRGVDTDAWQELRRQYDHLINVTAHTMEFAGFGWAPSSQMNIEAYAEALSLLRQGHIDEAEVVLTDAWDSEMVLRRVAHQVGNLGYSDQDLGGLFRLRADLLRKAVAHHMAGAYEASVPIVLAQCEGLVADVTGGKLFFSKHDQRKAEIVSAATIATLDEALPVVRDLFSQGQNVSCATGGLSRHGVLHGRELGYQTRKNSVKCFVLLQSLVEWAEPLVADEVEQRRLAREAHWAGSEAVDDRNRRRDRRGFRETCDLLTSLATAHMGWYRREDRYQDNVLDMMSSSSAFRALGASHGVTMQISDDGQSWWAWRRTEAGWVFGIGAVGEPPSQWFFDGPEPPAFGPDRDPEVWGRAPHVAGPNWTSI